MSNAVIPSMPMLGAIQDEPTRLALQQIVNAWKVRNGDVGDGSNKFLTADDLLNGIKTVNIFGAGAQGAIGGSNPNTNTPTNVTAWINQMLQTIDDSVRTSRLWADLTANLDGIDQSIVAEQQARISAVQGVADDLADEVTARLAIDNTHGSQIAGIIEVNQTQASQLYGLTTRMSGAESTIVGLQSTTATQATSLTSLTTRVGTAESNITGLQTTTNSQAQSLTSLTTRVGATETNISSLQTTTANQANSIASLSAGYKATQLGLPLEQWSIGSQSIVQLSDGKVGSSALRLSGIPGAYPNQGTYIPIDYSRKYRVRFWARPSSNASGVLYFSLRQFTNSSGSAGPVNGGRSPYKPSGVSRAAHIAVYGDTWGEYSYIWSAADWQSGVKYVQPEFLDNYSGGTGYWEVQGFSFEDETAAETLSASITSEATARANGDSALASTINTQVTAINGNISTLQTQYNNLSTTTGANSSAITSLQTSVAGVNTTAQSALTIASATSTAVNASWTVKFDANGYVVGAGLGLEGKNGTYTSSFVVVADKFLVARPDGTNPITMLEMGEVNGQNVLGFRGAIIGASGYFSGNLNASGGTFTGELVAATGTFAGLLQAGVLDLTRLQGYSAERGSPGTYGFDIQADFPVLRYQLQGGGGGGGVGDYGEWNTRAGGGGGGGAGQYVTGTTSSFAAGTQIRLVVGAAGAAGTEWQQNGGNGGATYLQYSTNGGATWTTFVTADYGRGGACAPDAYYDNADGDWAGGAGGFGYPSGENPGGGDNWAGDSRGNRGGNGASSMWGAGGAGVAGGGGGGATGWGAGGAGGGFHWGWRFNSWHNTGKYNGWYPGGAGTGGKAILEFFNPNAVLLQTTFNAFKSSVEATINNLPYSYAARAPVLGWSTRAEYNNCGGLRYSGYEITDIGNGQHQARNYSFNCYDCACNCSNCG